MRVFLSHSSNDKGIIETVASELRPGTYELDSVTFDKGLLNAQAVLDALNRCNMFCLFLSKNADQSSYVGFERAASTELYASGKIQRVLILCLDEDAFKLASKNERLFNIVRKVGDEASIARLIIGQMESISELSRRQSHPFVGRDKEMTELEDQIIDHSRPQAKAIYISGNIGSGRRSFAAHFYQKRFPHVGRVLPSVQINEFVGLWEVYRTVLASLRPTMRVAELRTRDTAFNIASNEEKVRLIAEQFNALLRNNEAITVIDGGGLHDNEGRFVPELNSIIANLHTRPHPPVIFISPRRINRKLRRVENDIAYASLESFTREASLRLMGGLLKDKAIVASKDELDELVELSEGHPFNFYRIVDEIVDVSLQGFLANPSDFNEWKHRRSSEYISKLEFSPDQSEILALLSHLPQLDMISIVGALGLDTFRVSDAISELINRHVIESHDGIFGISQALRIAVDKDKRVILPQDKKKNAITYLASSLSIRIEEGTAPITLIDSAVVAALTNEDTASTISAAFMLPSHHLWIAKRNYDQGAWSEALRLSKRALDSRSRLSVQGVIAACRYMCLSASRLAKNDEFQAGLSVLKTLAKDRWAQSNVAFLEGFNARKAGSLPAAEEFQRESHRLSNGNFSAARELAAICLVRENLDDAERFAREAHSIANRNDYVLDVLAAVLITKIEQGSNIARSEIEEILDRLGEAGENSGRSFHKTRSAHYQYAIGHNKEALVLIEEAIEQTPHIFEPRRLHAEMLLKEGNNAKAREVIDVMANMVYSKTSDTRRQNYREYLEVLSKYNSQIGEFAEAKKLYNDDRVFTTEERLNAIRRIEMDQSFRQRPRGR